MTMNLAYYPDLLPGSQDLGCLRHKHNQEGNAFKIGGLGLRLLSEHCFADGILDDIDDD